MDGYIDKYWPVDRKRHGEGRERAREREREREREGEKGRERIFESIKKACRLININTT